MMKNKFYLLLIIIAAGILPLVTNFNKKQEIKILPEITLTSIYTGTPISNGFNDKFILQLFATWCEKCNEYNHDLQQILKASNLKLPVFGIAIKDKDEYINKLYPKNNSPFDDIANDTKGFILADLGIRAIPETIFVKNNIIVKRIVGGANNKEILEFSND
jgi:thiol-disulfide isomerase/thioredoxin